MKKTTRILATLMMIMMLVSTMTAFVFAEEPAQVAAQGTEQAQEGTTPAVDPAKEAADKAAAEEAAAIKKYGYYHGTDATKIPVLTYHMVVSDSQKSKGKYKRSSLAISKSTFDKQMKWLHKRGYRAISCEEFYLWYNKKIKLPPKSVLITFDDGASGVAKYALPVLKKYKMHGVTFIVGSRTYKNKKGTIKYKQLQKLMKDQTYLEYQSHTYNLHKHFSAKGDYNKVLKDAAKQKKMYGFEYLAYPYGRNTKGMRKAYAESGIKVAFTYGKNGYATRSQNILQIRRIKVNAREPFSKFTRWFKK
jgi:peptidoglycan/xylan/chitin deacetylase (PgdA/CDA1 family)